MGIAFQAPENYKTILAKDQMGWTVLFYQFRLFYCKFRWENWFWTHYAWL
jgi:hypothetical protein